MADSKHASSQDEHQRMCFCLSDTALRWLSLKLGIEWCEMGTYLGYEKAFTDQLKLDNPCSTAEQIFSMLVCFRKKNPSGAYSTICDALGKCGNIELVQELKNYVKQQHPIICSLCANESEGRRQTTSKISSAPRNTNNTAVSDARVSCQHPCPPSVHEPEDRSQKTTEIPSAPMDTNNSEVSEAQLVESQHPIICPSSVHEPEDRQQKTNEIPSVPEDRRRTTSEIPSAPMDTNNSEVSDTQVSHQSRCAFRDPKKRSRQNSSRSRSSSKQSKDRCPLDAMSNAAYRVLKEDIAEELTKKDIKWLKKITVGDHTRYGIPTEQLATVNTAEQFLCSLEKNNLLGEDHLYYIQWLLHKRKKKEAVAAVEEYAKNISTYPLRLCKFVKRRRSGREYVEFRIIGNFRHAKMSDVNKFRRTVSEKLRIPRRFIRLSGLKNGSIIIVFEMPEVGINRLRQALDRRDPWLEENQVLDVHIHEGEYVKIQSENSRGIIDLHTAADKQKQGRNFAENDATGKISEKSLKRTISALSDADFDTDSDGLKKRLNIPKETQKERTGLEHPSGRISPNQSGKCHKVEENPPDSSNDKREQSSDRAGKECFSDTDKCFLEMGKGECHEIQENLSDSSNDKREKCSERSSKECVPDTDKSFLEIGKGECDHGGTLSSADRRIREEHHSDRPHEDYHQNTDQTFLEIDQDESIEEIRGTPADRSNERKQYSKRPSKEHVPDTDKSVLEMGKGKCHKVEESPRDSNNDKREQSSEKSSKECLQGKDKSVDKDVRDYGGTLSQADNSNDKRQHSNERSSKECLPDMDKSFLEMDKGEWDYGGTLSPADGSNNKRDQSSERSSKESFPDMDKSFLGIGKGECDHGSKPSPGDGIRVRGKQQSERPHKDCRNNRDQSVSNINQGIISTKGKCDHEDTPSSADGSNNKRDWSSERSSKECLPDMDKSFLEMGKGECHEIQENPGNSSNDKRQQNSERSSKGCLQDMDKTFLKMGKGECNHGPKPSPGDGNRITGRPYEDCQYNIDECFPHMIESECWFDFESCRREFIKDYIGPLHKIKFQQFPILDQTRDMDDIVVDIELKQETKKGSTRVFSECDHEYTLSLADSRSDNRQQSSAISSKECLPDMDKSFIEMGKVKVNHGGRPSPICSSMITVEHHSDNPHEDCHQDTDQFSSEINKDNRKPLKEGCLERCERNVIYLKSIRSLIRRSERRSKMREWYILSGIQYIEAKTQSTSDRETKQNDDTLLYKASQGNATLCQMIVKAGANVQATNEKLMQSGPRCADIKLFLIGDPSEGKTTLKESLTTHWKKSLTTHWKISLMTLLQLQKSRDQPYRLSFIKAEKSYLVRGVQDLPDYERRVDDLYRWMLFLQEQEQQIQQINQQEVIAKRQQKINQQEIMRHTEEMWQFEVNNVQRVNDNVFNSMFTKICYKIVSRVEVLPDGRVIMVGMCRVSRVEVLPDGRVTMVGMCRWMLFLQEPEQQIQQIKQQEVIAKRQQKINRQEIMRIMEQKWQYKRVCKNDFTWKRDHLVALTGQDDFLVCTIHKMDSFHSTLQIPDDLDHTIDFTSRPTKEKWVARDFSPFIFHTRAVDPGCQCQTCTTSCTKGCTVLSYNDKGQFGLIMGQDHNKLIIGKTGEIGLARNPLKHQLVMCSVRCFNEMLKCHLQSQSKHSREEGVRDAPGRSNICIRELPDSSDEDTNNKV